MTGKNLLHGKNITKHLQYNLSAALTLKADGENRQWHKTTRSKTLQASLTTTDTTGTGNTVKSHQRKWHSLSYLVSIDIYKMVLATHLKYQTN